MSGEPRTTLVVLRLRADSRSDSARGLHCVISPSSTLSAMIQVHGIVYQVDGGAMSLYTCARSMYCSPQQNCVSIEAPRTTLTCCDSHWLAATVCGCCWLYAAVHVRQKPPLGSGGGGGGGGGGGTHTHETLCVRAVPGSHHF
jgi:hypothetical protein